LRATGCGLRAEVDRTEAGKNTAEIHAPIPRNAGTPLAKRVTFVPPPAGQGFPDRLVIRPLSSLGMRSGTAAARETRCGELPGRASGGLQD
jgi:hypothetical protein